MAYTYTQYDDNRHCTVSYNITPSFSTVIGKGRSITITGQASCSVSAIKEIDVYITDDPVLQVRRFLVGSTSVNIAKNRTGTFTTSYIVPQPPDWMTDVDGIITGYIYFQIWFSGDSGEYEWTRAVDAQKFSVIKNRIAPVLSAVNLTDSFGPIFGTDTPLDYFGGYVAGQSLPIFTATFATDSRDTTLTTYHNLQIVDGGDNVIFDGTASAAALATTAAIDAPPIAAAGTYTYTWTVTDSAGLTATSTGTLTVLAYSPPFITAFAMQRYRHDAVSGTDVPADNGDRLWIDMDATIAAVASKNAWTLTMDYAETEGGTAYTAQIGSGSDGQTLALSDDTRLYDIYNLTFTASSAWAITMTITDALGNTVSAQCIVPKAGAYFDIEKTGVAVGMRSTGEPTDKKFEVAEDYTSHFYGGIGTLAVDWKLLTDITTLGTGVSTPGTTWSNSKLRIGRIGNHVYMRGGVSLPANNYSSSGKTRDTVGVTIANLPMEYMPSNIDEIADGGASNRYFAWFWLCPLSGANIARITLNLATGRLFVEWVRAMSNGSIVTSAITWVELNIDWWID